MRAVLLIGGRGTRLRPLTLSTPKPLLPLANKPFLRYQLRVLARHVDEVLLCAADPAPFRRELGARAEGVRLRYLGEDRPLGTGGAVKNAAAALAGERRFLVLNGDVLHNLDVAAFLAEHRRARALATIALTRVADPSAYGVVETGRGGRIERFIEKPSPDEAPGNTVNAGAYVFDRDALDAIPAGRAVSLEREVFPALIGGRRLQAWESRGYWIDIGTLERFLRAHLDLLGDRTGLPLPARCRPSLDGGRVCLGEGARVDETARFSGNVSVGPRVRVQAGATLRDCVILDGAVIGRAARVERCIVGPRCSVGERAVLTRATALAAGSRVQPYSCL